MTASPSRSTPTRTMPKPPYDAIGEVSTFVEETDVEVIRLATTSEARAQATTNWPFRSTPMAGFSAEPEPRVMGAPSVPSSLRRRATAYQLPSRISVHAAIAVPPGVTATTGVFAGADVESFWSGPTRLPEAATRRPTTWLSCCQTTAESPGSSEALSRPDTAAPSGDRVRIAPVVPFANFTLVWTRW